MSDTSSSVVVAPVHRSSRGRRAKKDPQAPQEKIDEFWGKYKTKAPGKVTSIIPQNEYAERAAQRASAKSLAPAKTTQQSYEEAADQCRHKVHQIVKECRRVNQKYRDPHFDLEIDLKLHRRDCLESLDNEKDDQHDDYSRGKDPPLKDRFPAESAGTLTGLIINQMDKERETAMPADGEADRALCPRAVKRVTDIFDEPKFYIDGPTANDVRQGRDGDCWLMAALCTISNKPGLIERCCVAHDPAVGVYGFVFHRDGEWFSEIIDDKLYLTKPDYDESLLERILWEDRERVNSEEAYRKIYQSNSGALYFAQCENPNETWLPLLEKAYAKAHGDYSAIEGGYGGEGIEDLTGGVTSEIYTTDILDKEHFWKEELMKVNQEFLFGCSTGVWGSPWGERRGILELHAYSVLKACEIDGIRLVLLKNPWGKHEWKGAWSDGSKEWTAEWLQKLDHKFGDDGSFWINYDDLLKKYQAFDRTRLFGPEWKVAGIWTTLNVSWTVDYHDTKFAFSLAKSGPVVIVLSQLDERYFKGLQGQYRFELSFRLHKAGEEDYLVRSQSYYRMNRSVNVELDLEAGEYVVVVKIDAQRDEHIMPVEEVVRAYAKERREKLLRIGLAYDVAHSKGKIFETPEEKAAREACEKRKRDKERKRVIKSIVKKREEEVRANARLRMKKKKAAEKDKARQERKQAKREARMKARMVAEEEERKREKEESSTSSDKPENQMADETSGDKTSQKEKAPNKTKGNEGVDKPHTEESETKTDTTDEERVKVEVPSEADSRAESSKDGDSVIEPGENTPTSSTMLERTPADDEEAQEEDAYVTAAEGEGENQDGPSTLKEEETYATAFEDEGGRQPATTGQPHHEEGPSTPQVMQHKSTPTARKRIDMGVQTGPGLRLPPMMAPGPPRYLHPAPPHPPPRPNAPYGPPPHDFRNMVPPPSQLLPPGYVYPDGRHASDTRSDSSDDDTMDDVASASDPSSDEIDSYLADEKAMAARAAATKHASEQPGRACEDDDELDEFEKDPWNAVGVFGLRVYYKTSEEDREEEVVRLRVERPNPSVLEEDSSDDEADDERDDDDDKKEKGKGKGKDARGRPAPAPEAEESKVLDVDDSAKDAVGEEAGAADAGEAEESKNDGEKGEEVVSGKSSKTEDEKEAGKDESDINKEEESEFQDAKEDTAQE